MTYIFSTVPLFVTLYIWIYSGRKYISCIFFFFFGFVFFLFLLFFFFFLLLLLLFFLYLILLLFCILLTLNGNSCKASKKVCPILVLTQTHWTGPTGTRAVPFMSRGGQQCAWPRTHADVEGEEEDAFMNRYPGIGAGAASVGTEMVH